MSEWIMNILKPLIKQAVEETSKEFDEQYYRGVIYGETREKLKRDMEHEEQLYRIFNEGVKEGEERKAAELGAIEEITAEEFDRLCAQNTKTEIPENFGFVGTIDDLSLVLDESEAV